MLTSSALVFGCASHCCISTRTIVSVVSFSIADRHLQLSSSRPIEKTPKRAKKKLKRKKRKKKTNPLATPSDPPSRVSLNLPHHASAFGPFYGACHTFHCKRVNAIHHCDRSAPLELRPSRARAPSYLDRSLIASPRFISVSVSRFERCVGQFSQHVHAVDLAALKNLGWTFRSSPFPNIGEANGYPLSIFHSIGFASIPRPKLCLAGFLYSIHRSGSLRSNLHVTQVISIFSLIC
jgi:hypothetical protein